MEHNYALKVRVTSPENTIGELKKNNLQVGQAFLIMTRNPEAKKEKTGTFKHSTKREKYYQEKHTINKIKSICNCYHKQEPSV